MYPMYQELGTNWVQIVVALKLSFPVLIGLLRVPQSEAPLLYKIKKGASGASNEAPAMHQR